MRLLTPMFLLTTLLFTLACSTPAPTATATRPASTPTPMSSSLSSGQNKQYARAPGNIVDPNKTYKATIQTSKGDIVVNLLAKEAPLTVSSFIFLSRDNFFDNIIFHRIYKGFMVQTGDPTGTGSGGPGYSFQDEPVKRSYVKGTVAMANSGPNTNGSQFFIVHAADAQLPPNYTIFGVVESGLDVVDKIANTPVVANTAMRGEVSKPTERVSITHIDITES